MSPERQRQLASLGGKAAHLKGTAHEFSRGEAREAGAKGGRAAHERGTAHEFTPEQAREAGRRGGRAASQRDDPAPASHEGVAWDVDDEDGE